MANTPKNNNDSNSTSDVLWWVGILFAFGVAWPLGIILLCVKLFSGKSKKQDAEKASRFRKYSAVVAGYDAIPLSVIADAMDLPIGLVRREIQEMLSKGMFGTEAYLNYMTQVLVIHASAGQNSSGKKTEASSAWKSTAKRTTPPREKRKFSQRLLSVILIIIGAFLLLAALGGLLELVDTAVWFGMLEIFEWYLYELFTTLLFAAGGILSLTAGIRQRRRFRRYPKYLALLHGKDIVSLEDIAASMGVSVRTARKDLDSMIEQNMFGPEAYIDLKTGSFIRHASAKPEYAAPVPEEQPPKNEYAAILKEIRDLDEAIRDEAVSARIVHIENITAKIFRIVEDHPEKEPQIKTFMSYYLPTTLKLLRSYSTFEKQGIGGENIDTAKREIERILDTLSKGFAQQLDQLFREEALDISTDIDVLESMLKKDGLTEETAFQTQQNA